LAVSASKFLFRQRPGTSAPQLCILVGLLCPCSAVGAKGTSESSHNHTAKRQARHEEPELNRHSGLSSRGMRGFGFGLWAAKRKHRWRLQARGSATKCPNGSSFPGPRKALRERIISPGLAPTFSHLVPAAWRRCRPASFALDTTSATMALRGSQAMPASGDVERGDAAVVRLKQASHDGMRATGRIPLLRYKLPLHPF
jgi:hypothetical protein